MIYYNFEKKKKKNYSSIHLWPKKNPSNTATPIKMEEEKKDLEISI